MTTSATTPRLNYTGDGSTTDFTFNYEIADQNSIAVYVGSTRQTLTTDYTVAFDSGTAGTGTVTFLSAPANAADIYLIRETDNIRTTDFQEGGAFLAATINNELDRLTQGIQDLENIIENTTIKIAEPTTETATLTLPDAATRANKQLSFDGSGVLQVTTAGTGTVTSLATGTGLTGGPITTSGTISIDTGTTVDVSTAQTLTNKTLTAPIISTISNTGTLTLPTSTDTLVGRATTDTFTNKSGNISQWTNDSNYLTSATVTIVGDTSPQLGGNLDLNGNTVFGTGNISINGSLYAGDAVFSGNLTVEGTTTTVNTANLSVEDAFIELNRNNSSTATDADAGIFIRNGYTGAGTDYNPAFYWDHGDQKFRFMITDVDPNTSPASLNDGTTTLANVAMGSLSSGPITAQASKFYGITFMNNNSQDALEIDQNNITGLRSNDDINIRPAGTGQVSADSILNVNSNRIINVASPTTGTDAANQDYVDTAIGTINAIAQLDSNVTVTDSGTGSITATADGNLIFTATDAAGLTMSKDIAMGGNSITGLNSLTSTGTAALDGVTITDNVITTNRSNDNLRLTGSGTGLPSIGPDDFFENNTLYEQYFGATSRVKIAGMRFDQTVDADTAERTYGLGIAQNTTVTGSSSTNSNFIQRAMTSLNTVDMAGFDYTRSSFTRGPQAGTYSTNIVNTGATASTINTITGASNWASAYADTSTYAAGDLTITNAIANAGTIELYSGAFTGNFTITNAYAFRSFASIDGSNDTVTNMYGFYHGASSSQTGTITNNYAFYDATNSLSVFGDIQTQAVSITDNLITTNRSNDNFNIEANGTGQIQIRAAGGDFANLSTQGRYSNANIMYHEDFDFTLGVDRAYRNVVASNYKCTTGQNSSSSNDRFRNFAVNKFDLNGSTSSAVSSYLSRGPIGWSVEAEPTNSSTSNAVLGNAQAVQGGMYLTTSNTGDLTITGANSGVASFTGWVDLESNAGSSITVDNAYVFYSVGLDQYGSGTNSVSNFYHFYAKPSASSPNDEYAFYSADDDLKSRVGKLERYREKINSLTSDSTITVDCGRAPVHTVTLGHNTEFNISNLGTGQTATIIITQDGTGNRTASFGTDTSTAVKFPGGVPSLSTGGGDIDIVSVFNDGTNYLGNIAKDYS